MNPEKKIEDQKFENKPVKFVEWAEGLEKRMAQYVEQAKSSSVKNTNISNKVGKDHVVRKGLIESIPPPSIEIFIASLEDNLYKLEDRVDKLHGKLPPEFTKVSEEIGKTLKKIQDALHNTSPSEAEASLRGGHFEKINGAVDLMSETVSNLEDYASKNLKK